MRKSGVFVLTVIALGICGFIEYKLYDTKVDLNSADSVSSGKWCVEVTDLSKPSVTGQAESKNGTVDGTSIQFDAKLTDLQDSIEYKAKVSNCGTIDAYLYDVTLTGPDNKDAILYLVEGIEKKDTLKKGETVSISIKVSSNDEEPKQMPMKLDLNFTQGD